MASVFNVPLQIPNVRETFPAQIAPMRLLPGVDQIMHLQAIRVREDFPAYVAFVRLFTMRQSMFR